VRPALALVEKVLVMSIWTDLLFLGGYVATPTGLAALAPELGAPASPAPGPAVAAVAAPVRVRLLPRPNKVSPNDLW
jgi:hypothetical protein